MQFGAGCKSWELKGKWKGKWKGKGKGKPGMLASGSIHPDARYSQQEPQEPLLLVSRELTEALERWRAWPSFLLLEPGGLADFARRNTMLLEEHRLPPQLIAELPEDPSAAAWRRDGWDVPAAGGAGDMPAAGGAGDMPATGGAGDMSAIVGAQEAWKFITDLCWRHRVRGEWCEFDGPLPREMLNRGEGWPLAAGGGGEK